MWEVVWTDPNKESVKEHRERKAMQKEQREQRERTRPQQRSTSNRSSASSDNKSFGIFGPKGLKRSTVSKASSTTSPTPTSPTTLAVSTSSEHKPRRVSHLSTTTSVASVSGRLSEVSTNAVQPSSVITAPDQFIDSFQNSPGSSNREPVDSVFSKWAEGSGLSYAPSSPCNTSMTEKTTKSSLCVQTLGPSSFITKDTEVTVSPRSDDNDIASVTSETRISADPTRDAHLALSHSPTSSNFIAWKHDTPVMLFPGQSSSPRNSLTRAPPWATNFKPNNPDSWKPPEDWDCVPSPEQRASTFEDIMEEPGEVDDDLALSLDLSAMQREIKRMSAASSRIRLIRLKETWGVSDDANLYRELEMEQKRWMLSSLDHMSKPLDMMEGKKVPPKVAAAAKSKKVLALYESQATTSYLAAVHCDKNIYHLSTSPLSHELFPNIHPVRVPAVSSTSFPIAQGLFGAVYSLCLPSLVSSSEVPKTLKSIHRALSVGGAFHITLIDPLPSATTLGPRLREWLDKHLLFNLERNFRCMNPSKLFPIWLADASLRAEGSTITMAQFFAVAPSSTKVPSTATSEEAAERAVNQELGTLVGRLLWKEVWGQLIEADTWWWEDPAIVEECQARETTWAYSKIEAIKEV
ncbi:hypothetical protein F5X68DRAFT_176159 [Plectosphaerella plurivora]|uniref:Methyltransferase type 11 domain-containing protein n=1 Tax=Plectosphaerella plurivora TaxID=936078 RepID=A0A9P8V357_9PEZI|nr:hypothetical protein F5X68DRAFT_176159 [Plectosphaerella plurivora]